MACRPVETFVTGCQNGMPLAGVRLLGPGSKPTSAAGFAAMREGVWRKRGEASGFCLLTYAKFWAETNVARARILAATGAVRSMWEARRCEPTPRPAVDGADYRGGAALYLMMLQTELAADRPAWTAAVKAAAADPATYRESAIDVGVACKPAAPLPRSQWPTIRDKLRGELLHAGEPTS